MEAHGEKFSLIDPLRAMSVCTNVTEIQLLLSQYFSLDQSKPNWYHGRNKNINKLQTIAVFKVSKDVFIEKCFRIEP